MKVTFVQKELDAIKEALDYVSVLKGKRGGQTELTKVLTHLVEKMEKAKAKTEVPRDQNTILVKDLLNMARLILGSRLKEQVNPSGIWYKQMQFRIDSRNITKAMANVALETCRDTWKGEVWIDTLINSLDKLCVMTPQNQAKTKLGWVKRLDEMDAEGSNDGSY